MSYNWFNCLYFSPRNKCLPELIMQDGNRAPLRQISKIEMLMDITKESFVGKFKEPLIIYNGTHNIPNLDKLFISDTHTNILKTQRVHFFFMEVLTHYIPNPWGKLEPHILKIDNEPEKLNKIRCYELDTLNQWAKENDIDLYVYCTDHKSWEYYQKIYPNIKLRSMDLFVSWYSSRFQLQEEYNRSGMLPGDIYPVIEYKKIRKKFFSGSWRYDPSRHFITAFLASEGLTKDNEISFYHKSSNEDMIANMWFDWEKFANKHPAMSQSLLKGTELLQPQLPLSFEVKNPISCDLKQGDPDYNTPGMYNRRRTQDPYKTYERVFCAIINESRVTQPWPNVSEKTLNAMKSFRPFVLVAAPHTLKYLKEMGYKTFSDFWPEDYDDIQCTSDRLVEVCNTIKYIDSFSIEDCRKIYKKLIPRLMHNYNVLQKNYKWFDEYNLKLDSQSSSAQYVCAGNL